MTARCCIALLTLLLALGEVSAADETRFRPVDIYVDSGAERMAAYQLEIVATNATIVGVEGGESAAFREPPFYDPKALAGGRIKLAAFQTRGELPRGRTRVATLHMREGQSRVTYEGQPTAAATSDGRRIEITVSVEPRE